MYLEWWMCCFNFRKSIKKLPKPIYHTFAKNWSESPNFRHREIDQMWNWVWITGRWSFWESTFGAPINFKISGISTLIQPQLRFPEPHVSFNCRDKYQNNRPLANIHTLLWKWCNEKHSSYFQTKFRGNFRCCNFFHSKLNSKTRGVLVFCLLQFF